MTSFGEILRRYRRQRHLSLRNLQRKIQFDYSYISQIERGTRRPTLQFAQACEDALDTGGILVDTYRQDQTGDATMRRRSLLHAMGALVATPAAESLAELEALRHGLAAATGYSEWEQVVADYGHDFYVAAPAQLVEQLRGDLTVLQHQLAAAPADRTLLRAAGSLSVIMTMALSAMGQNTMARRWWRTARTHADQSGCTDTRVWVRNWEVVNGTYERRPIREILDRADEATAIVGDRACVGHAGVLAGRAQALAVAGQTESALKAVEATAAMTDRMPAEAMRDTASMFGWPEVRLRHTESYVYTHLGHTQRALAAQDRALELYPADLGWERAQMLMHRASCLIQDGHIGDGLRYAADVLDALPQSDHNALLYQVATAVVTQVPEQELRRVEVVDLRQRLAELPSG